MRRGEIWWASLPEPVGSGLGLRRPVVVVQANSFNQSRISTVIVAVITSNLALGEAPGNVRLGRAESGLAKPSVVNASQILTIDKTLLTEKVKSLPVGIMEKIAEGISMVLGL